MQSNREDPDQTPLSPASDLGLQCLSMSHKKDASLIWVCFYFADLFLFYYERDFMLSLSDNNQVDVVEAFNSTSRYLNDLLNIDIPYFAQMASQIYPTKLQLNKANLSNTEALDLYITNSIV